MGATSLRFCSLQNPAGTESFARLLAARAKPNDIYALKGALGIGKTHFARAFIRYFLGAQAEVPSPTFTLVQYYPVSVEGEDITLLHADLFRLSNPEEVEELALTESRNIVLIEWPERAHRLPRERTLAIEFDEAAVDARKATLWGGEAWRKRLVDLPERFDGTG